MIKLGRYEAKPCPRHVDNKGNVFLIEQWRLDMFGVSEYEEMLKCGCLVPVPPGSLDNINNVDRL